MNLYVVTDTVDDPEMGGWWLVWSPTPEEAVARCVRLSEGPEWLRAEPAGLPWWQPEEEGVHIERRRAVKRDAGFMAEGDRSCDTCGLYELDGLAPVCPDCRQCPDCGCDCADEPNVIRVA